MKAREHWFIETRIQSALMLRMAIYCVVGFIFISMPITFFRATLGTQQGFVAELADVWRVHWPVFFSLILFLPLALFDMARFSNRIVGPIARLKKEIQVFEETGQIRQFSIRDNDYWPELYRGVNQLIAHVHELESRLSDHPQLKTREEYQQAAV
jgi:hypothetical protein